MNYLRKNQKIILPFDYDSAKIISDIYRNKTEFAYNDENKIIDIFNKMENNDAKVLFLYSVISNTNTPPNLIPKLFHIKNLHLINHDDLIDIAISALNRNDLDFETYEYLILFVQHSSMFLSFVDAIETCDNTNKYTISPRAAFIMAKMMLSKEIDKNTNFVSFRFIKEQFDSYLTDNIKNQKFSEKILSQIANNTNLSNEVRNLAFDAGCDYNTIVNFTAHTAEEIYRSCVETMCLDTKDSVVASNMLCRLFSSNAVPFSCVSDYLHHINEIDIRCFTEPINTILNNNDYMRFVFDTVDIVESGKINYQIFSHFMDRLCEQNHNKNDDIVFKTTLSKITEKLGELNLINNKDLNTYNIRLAEAIKESGLATKKSFKAILACKNQLLSEAVATSLYTDISMVKHFKDADDNELGFFAKLNISLRNLSYNDYTGKRKIMNFFVSAYHANDGLKPEDEKFAGSYKKFIIECLPENDFKDIKNLLLDLKNKSNDKNIKKRIDFFINMQQEQMDKEAFYKECGDILSYDDTIKKYYLNEDANFEPSVEDIKGLSDCAHEKIIQSVEFYLKYKQHSEYFPENNCNRYEI